MCKISDNSDESEYREKRHKNLQYLHEMLIQLIIHHGRLVSERLNSFLVFNSILFASLIVLLTQPILPGNGEYWEYLGYVIPVVGFLICISYVYLVLYSIEAVSFYKSSIALIEKHDDYKDFWYPDSKKEYLDLDIFEARRRFLDKKATLQTLQEQNKDIINWKIKIIRCLPLYSALNTYHDLCIPGAIAIIWIVVMFYYSLYFGIIIVILLFVFGLLCIKNIKR